MRIVFLTILTALLAVSAHAKPVDKATALPFAVQLEWASSHSLINAIQLDCRIHDGKGHGVGRGTWETQIDPVFLSRRGTIRTVLPAVVHEGTDPEAGLKCDCRARFDTRSPFFRRHAGSDRFGRLPWMFARPIRFAETSCKPLPTRAEES